MSYTKEDTIFVQIASYRDSELQWTLKDLFEKAKRPENIFVGICHQYDMKGDEDKHLFEIPFSHPEQLRIDGVDYRESQGCCWARNRVQKLWRGEKWTLMTDSHMRFDKNWDEVLVKDAKKFNNPLFTIIASSYNKYTNDTYFNTNNYKMTINITNKIGIFRSNRSLNKNKKISNGITFYANFCFSLSEIFFKSYFNPLLLVNDEVPSAFLFFSNGGNIYNYDKMLVNHLWMTEEEKKSDVSRSNTYKNSNISDAIFLNIFNIKKTKNKEILESIKKYNKIGKERTLRDYERFSGIDFRKKTTRQHTKEGYFEDWQEVAKIDEIKNIFVNKYKD